MDKRSELIEEVVAKWCADKTPENYERAILVCQEYVKGIVSKVHNSVPQLLEFDDLAQYGIIGLISALKRYDPAKGVPFRTWCYPRIKGAAMDAVRRLSPVSRTRNSPMGSFEVSEPFIAEIAQEEEIEVSIGDLLTEGVSKALISALEELTSRQKVIVLFLLNGMKSKSIAIILDVSVSRIQQERQISISRLAEILAKSMGNTVQSILTT